MVTSKTAIELTDAATSKLLEVLDEQDAQGQYLRIAVITAAHGGIDYQFGLEETPSEWDRVIEGAVKVLIDDESDTVTVQGVNVRWKHMRRSAANPDGGRVQREFPIDISNVQVFSEKAGKGVRVKTELGDGKRVRVGIPCGTRFD